MAAQSLTINVTQQGDYTIWRKDGTVWLRSAPAFFIVNNVTYSAADSTLTLLGVNTTKTADYLTYNLYYRANVTGIVASVNVYNTGYIGFTVVSRLYITISDIFITFPVRKVFVLQRSHSQTVYIVYYATIRTLHRFSLSASMLCEKINHSFVVDIFDMTYERR